MKSGRHRDDIGTTSGRHRDDIGTTFIWYTHNVCQICFCKLMVAFCLEDRNVILEKTVVIEVKNYGTGPVSL